MTEEGPGPLVAAGEILEMLGVGRSRFRQIQMHPKFPRPYQVLTVGSIWLRADIEKYIREHRQPRPPADEDAED
ncbi:helix-turn-helix transcriptional regulator [Micromonospora vulcania]|uniref:Helix-turn-helix transcriptional regulator n=1 Tax=Micromonospora vulcania TaxID=1441873 RepID=A0ABW1H6Y4_9ACTN